MKYFLGTAAIAALTMASSPAWAQSTDAMQSTDTQTAETADQSLQYAPYPERFMTLDKNGDSVLTEDEWQDETDFANVDDDGTGDIGMREYYQGVGLYY